jgi:hypothetical protein
VPDEPKTLLRNPIDTHKYKMKYYIPLSFILSTADKRIFAP